MLQALQHLAPPPALAVEPHRPPLLQLALEVAHHQSHLPQLPLLQALQLEVLLHHQVWFASHKLLLNLVKGTV